MFVRVASMRVCVGVSDALTAIAVVTELTTLRQRMSSPHIYISSQHFSPTDLTQAAEKALTHLSLPLHRVCVRRQRAPMAVRVRVMSSVCMLGR